MARPPTFVIVGASLAGGTAAATLREAGFDGRLVLIGDESDLPYERPPLSKWYLRGERPREDLSIRPADWWEANEVEVRIGQRAQLLDPREKTVMLADGQRIAFDRALVATGVRNRRLEVPGIELEGVHQLRRVADADAIRRGAAGATTAVIVGMGFIGAEVAASLRQIGLNVTIVEIFQTALYRVLGAEIGRVLEAIHRDHGVEMLFGESVERFEGDGRLERVVTRGGRTVDCDLAVVGVGTEPNADVMRQAAVGSGVGIHVGPALATSFPGVFAAGDVATHDHPVFGPVRVEHFDNAIKMGQHAAHAMLGSTEPFEDPHWFWSDQYEHEIQMAGVALTEDMVVRGSLEERSFCAFFRDRMGVLRAAVSIDRPRDVRRCLKLIQKQVVCDPASLADPDVDLRKLLPEEG